MAIEFLIPGRIPRFTCLSPDDEGALRQLELNEHSKLVHFIRHGQAFHQLKAKEAKEKGIECRCHLDEEYEKECPYNDPALVDSSLTELGREQVVGRAMSCSAEVILASPTRRALETALWAFTPKNERIKQPSKALIPQIVALEELRARVGVHMHSKRSSISQLSKDFPCVDFTKVKCDDDEMWRNETESRTSLDFRAARFLQVLFERHEKSVAVITHFTLLITLFNPPKKTLLLGETLLRPDKKRAWLDCRNSTHDGYLSDMLAPGEVRSMVVTAES